jgi:transposase
MTKRYRVTLTADERDELERLLARGKADVRKIKHAQILLKADEADGGPGWPDQRIAEALEVGIATVERVRRRFVEEGLASALSPYRGGKRIYEHKLDGAQEAHLIALACSAPPEGRARWTLRLLARRMVELAYVDTLSYETVRQTLKKMRSSRTAGGCGASPRNTRRSSSSTWKMCWRSTTARTIPSVQWCAWMRPSNS